MNRQQLIRDFEKAQHQAKVADIRVGETVKVHYKIREGNKERVQVFQGLVIATKAGRTIQGSFTVRKVVSGVGVERTFPLHSPFIVKIERVKSGKVRQARLNFVRAHALSSRFKLKDKGVAGTIWETIAEEHSEMAKAEAEQAESAADATEETADSPVAESEQTGQDKADELQGQESGADGGESSGSAAGDQEAADSGEKSSD